MRLSKDQPHAYQFALSHAMHAVNRQFGWKVKWHNDYSGRGMFGKKCVALSGPLAHVMAAMGYAMSQATQDNDNSDGCVGDFTRFLMEFSKDDFGKSDMIFYWPTLEPFPQHIMDADDPEDTDWDSL